MGKKEKEVFRKNFNSFCDILKHEDSLHTHLVGKDIISLDDLYEIRSKSVGEKGPTLLKHISGPLNAGRTRGFYELLEIMRDYGKSDTQKFAEDIIRECKSNGIDEVDLKETQAEEADCEVMDEDESHISTEEEPIYTEADLRKRYGDQKTEKLMLQFDNLNSQQKDIVSKVQAIIVVVNDNELLATMSYLAPPDHQTTILSIQCKSPVGPDIDARIFHVGKFGKCPVAVTQVQQGSGKDAVSHARKEFFKNLVLIAAVGVAAGFPENGVKLGDVLISDQIQDCSIFKRQGEDIPRGNKIPAAKFVRQLLKHHIDWKYPCTKDESRDSLVKSGLILSNSMLLNDKAERERLLEFYGKEAKGFEMEGFSIMGSSLDFIVIKGVCDLGNKKDDLWQPTAALAANDYLHHHFCKTDLSILIENEQGILDKIKNNCSVGKIIIAVVIVTFFAAVMFIAAYM